MAIAQQGRLVDMGTGFDDFTARAEAYATDGVSAQAQANRALLRSAMTAGGLAPYSGEWWHFDGPGTGAGDQRPAEEQRRKAENTSDHAPNTLRTTAFARRVTRR